MRSSILAIYRPSNLVELRERSIAHAPGEKREDVPRGMHFGTPAFPEVGGV